MADGPMKRCCTSRFAGEMPVRTEMSWRGGNPGSDGPGPWSARGAAAPVTRAWQEWLGRTHIGGRIFAERNALVPYDAAVTQRAIEDRGPEP